MRRGPVQDRTVPLQRQQTLSTARRHSLSELFQLLHDFVPRPVRRSAWLYSYMFRLAGHYGSSGMAGQNKKGGKQLRSFVDSTSRSAYRIECKQASDSPSSEGKGHSGSD
ncbi:hypothetical protein QVD17_42321 [Tagetes erecta]|uniref:Uncharacterized protein n=1 Tax=Tagetes erecta TaxID=13708 RepID=A0AAD8JK74_TARER|nr:hypothetical protein QVD17_42321 [Tagetes erecta]